MHGRKHRVGAPSFVQVAQRPVRLPSLGLSSDPLGAGSRGLDSLRGVPRPQPPSPSKPRRWRPSRRPWWQPRRRWCAAAPPGCRNLHRRRSSRCRGRRQAARGPAETRRLPVTGLGCARVGVGGGGGVRGGAAAIAPGQRRGVRPPRGFGALPAPPRRRTVPRSDGLRPGVRCAR
jgi:hypothetical protein